MTRRCLRRARIRSGVGPQYAGALGKKTNCQTLVSLTLARDEVPIPVSLRLFLPDTWINAPERLQRAGVPEAFWVARSNRLTAECYPLMSVAMIFGPGSPGRCGTAAAARPRMSRSPREIAECLEGDAEIVLRHGPVDRSLGLRCQGQGVPV